MSVLKSIHWTSSEETLRRGLLPSFPCEFGFLGRQQQRSEAPPFSGHYVKQVHGTRIAEAQTEQTGPQSQNRREADGIACTEAGVSIAVQTADCLPLLFYSLERPFVMAVHGGWRGLASGILAEALRCARRSGCLSEGELAVMLGPAIGALRYEVGPEVLQAFSGSGLRLTREQLACAVSKGTAERWHLDLATAACLSLYNLGINPRHISVLRSCSFEQEKLWYSYRRSGAKPGRIWSWIKIAH